MVYGLWLWFLVYGLWFGRRVQPAVPTAQECHEKQNGYLGLPFFWKGGLVFREEQGVVVRLQGAGSHRAIRTELF